MRAASGAGYTDEQRSLQDRFGSRPLADRIDELLVHDAIGPDAAAFIESRDMMFVASVDGPLVSEVKRGENAGRTLRHGSVVRSLARGPARADSVLTLPGTSGRVVAWVQRPGGPVLGVASLDS